MPLKISNLLNCRYEIAMHYCGLESVSLENDIREKDVAP